LLQNKRITFIIFEVWSNHFVKLIAQHMTQYDYQCFLLTKDKLVPVDEHEWWYTHLDNFTRGWWGNGLCGIKGNPNIQMMWRMYHSDDLKLLNSETTVTSAEPIADHIYTKAELHAIFTGVVEKGTMLVASCRPNLCLGG
jgi:hypothetical protein